MDYAIFDLTTCESLASDTLDGGSMFVQIAEGLIPGRKGCLETAYLPK